MAIETQEEFRRHYISAQQKLQEGASEEELTSEEREALEVANSQPNSPHDPREQQEQLIRNVIEKKERGETLSGHEEEVLKLIQMPQEAQQFYQKTKQHKGHRVIHITDTEAEPEDLEKILDQNIAMAGGLMDKDVFVHTGDMLADFINFQTKEQFRANRIVAEGSLEGEIEKEFRDAYTHLLKHNGIDDYDLMSSGQMTQEFAQGLQRMYFGVVPHFLSNKEKEAYRANYDKFKEHMSTAIRNDARKKYTQYKKALEERGLTPENTFLLEGNHDVPDVMREVLGDYMTNAGGVAKRKGLKIGNPLNGSTGAHLGHEFGDTFGYTDITEKLEQYKTEAISFQDLHSHLKDNGVDYIDEKDLSHLIQVSQQRAAQGIGKGSLGIYFDDRIKPEIDARVDAMRGKVINRIPKDVDFYAMHGMPNGPHAGIEEIAFLKAIEEQGGNVLHGHQHGNTTHKQGKSFLLNQGNGQAFGAYLYDQDSKQVGDMLTRTYNKNLGDFELDLLHSRQIGVRKNPKEYQ